MSVYSMTGYASGRQPAAGASGEAQAWNASQPRVTIELRSVNSRFLDLSLRLPDELRRHEPALRDLLTKRLKRGKVELRAFIEGRDASALREPPARLLQRLAALQDQVRTWLPDAAPLGMADIIRLAGSSDSNADAGLDDSLLPLAEQVLADLMAARAREGERLVELLRERLHQLRALVAQAEPMVPQLLKQHKQRFLARWNEALSATPDSAASQMAEERALSEATAFAIRIDVAEEMGRLVAHLDEIDHTLAGGGDIGKRLDFQIQELHREANTLGSKSAMLELTRIALDMKVLIEQMREQVQNIE